jgi:hypothetical protein
MTSSFLIFGATITLPGETEAGSAGKQPCRGITWWAHRNDDWSVDVSLLRSSENNIGSVDPDALNIPARRAESTLTEDAHLPFHAEPEQTEFGIHPIQTGGGVVRVKNELEIRFTIYVTSRD